MVLKRIKSAQPICGRMDFDALAADGPAQQVEEIAIVIYQQNVHNTITDWLYQLLYHGSLKKAKSQGFYQHKNIRDRLPFLTYKIAGQE